MSARHLKQGNFQLSQFFTTSSDLLVLGINEMILMKKHSRAEIKPKKWSKECLEFKPI